MADLALERRMLIDDTRIDDRGEKVLKVLPWQYVVYANGLHGLEPVDYAPMRDVASSGNIIAFNHKEKEVRGIEFIDEGTMFRKLSTAGEVGLPIG